MSCCDTTITGVVGTLHQARRKTLMGHFVGDVWPWWEFGCTLKAVPQCQAPHLSAPQHWARPSSYSDYNELMVLLILHTIWKNLLLSLIKSAFTKKITLNIPQSVVNSQIEDAIQDTYSANLWQSTGSWSCPSFLNMLLSPDFLALK